MTGVCFLDIDGVCNSARYFRERDKNVPEDPVFWRRLHDLDPSAVPLLNALAAYDFVLSSSWRHIVELHEMEALLQKRGFQGSLVGRTPFGREMEGSKIILGEIRGHEIQDYLNRHPYDRFVILDDSDDMAHLAPWLVRTTWEDGLTPEHVTRALRMLEAK